MAMQQRAAVPIAALVGLIAGRSCVQCNRVMIVDVRTMMIVIILVVMTLVAAFMRMHYFLRHASRQQRHQQQCHGASARGTAQLSENLFSQCGERHRASLTEQGGEGNRCPSGSFRAASACLVASASALATSCCAATAPRSL